MTKPTDEVLPDIQSLFQTFPPAGYLSEYVEVPAAEVPQPYQKLLVHEHHMTVTVEAHHGTLVDVQVLDEQLEGDSYTRKILLSCQNTGKIVQFGLVRIHLQYCTPEVREQILAKKTPLGRILIKNDVLRRIEPTAFLRVIPGPEMMQWFQITEPVPTYGRLAMIHCDNLPAIELLEIVSPQ